MLSNKKYIATALFQNSEDSLQEVFHDGTVNLCTSY